MANFWAKDKGLKGLVATFELNANETAAFVGYLRSSGLHKTESGQPLTVAKIAMVNEFGTSKIPERSFFRSTLNEQKKKLKAKIKGAAARVASGKQDKKQALGLIAEWLVLQFKNKIQENVPPPNAESTIARKGSSHTLIDTGQMRDSLDWELKEGKR